MKKQLATLVVCSAVLPIFASVANDAMTNTATVVMTSLTAKQRFPWNGKVDIDFSFSSTIPEAFAFIHFKAEYKNANNETVTVSMKTFDQFTTAFCTNAGTYRVTWNSTADAPNLIVTNLKYTVTANMAKYMVVDLSKGTAATADDPYPITYMEECPDPMRDDGGWTDEYKTTKMVFRLVQPGTYKKGWDTNFYSWKDCFRHDATITRPFYLAIFECTQGQAKQLNGDWYTEEDETHKEFKGTTRAQRPVAQVRYSRFRGQLSNGVGWPQYGSTVAPNSFIGQLRARTGNNVGFDLPTETEWEYAARAGATDAWGGDGLTPGQKASNTSDGATGAFTNSLVNVYGRYKFNGGMVDNGDGTYSEADPDDDSHGTAVVGSYKPNAWGFYDMMGNVVECMLDAGTAGHGESGNAPPTVDDVGIEMSNTTDDYWQGRVMRGGCYNTDARECSFACRRGTINMRHLNGAYGYGYRLCWRFPFAGTLAAEGE